MFLEIELKLSIDPKHIPSLHSHPLLTQHGSELVSVERLISRYFDTSHLHLWQKGLSLRLRESEGRTIQTLKTKGKQIGDLHHRCEWDQPINQTTPHIEQFEDKAVIKKLKKIIGEKKLFELFNTDFQRTQWNLVAQDNTQIELVLDQGFVNTASHRSPLHEIELELKHGNSHQLYKIAEQLKQVIPLTTETRSKAARGYLLYNEQ